tara:strand:- start:5402 stop:6568 length:1167 start_codon:yes stop_codon:yes gene_type:complete
MAFGSDRSANFVIAAKDAATKPLGVVGKAMGKLKGVGVAAFASIATAAIAAAAALIAFAADAIRAAAEDEKATIRLNAALKARGFEMDQLTPKIDEQIKAMARLGFTDDDVRAGLETGSRFFKNQNNLLKANAVAANIAAATGKDLASVMMTIGKGAQGSTRGLLALGIEVEKGAKLKDILRLADEKYLGVAEEVANSTSGKFAAAQIRFNEAIESFGSKLLPMVNEALAFLTDKALPAFESLMADLGPVVSDLVDNYVRPLVDSVGELFAIFDNGEGSINILTLALAPLKLALEAIKFVIDAIVAGLKIIGVGAGETSKRALNNAADAGGYNGGSYVNPMNAGGTSTNLTTTTNLYLDRAVVATSTSLYLGSQSSSSTAPRTNRRGP